MFLIKIAVLINVRYKDSECSAIFTFFIYFLKFTTPNIISLATCNSFLLFMCSILQKPTFTVAILFMNTLVISVHSVPARVIRSCPPSSHLKRRAGHAVSLA